MPAKFDRWEANRAAACVVVCLLKTESTFSLQHRSFSMLFYQKYGEDLVTRDQLVRADGGLLPKYFGKWWDHDVTASRACLLEKDGWEDSKSCIKGEGGLLVLPKNSDIKDYSIEIKWNENGAEQYVKFKLTDENLE